LAYLMLGKAMFKLFMVTELIFAATFVAFSWFFTDIFGLEGVTMAYAVNYAIYWIVMGVFMSRKLDTVQ
ncbi:hypothetical protein QUB74_29565, partial [Microcoleus sp. A2-C2]